MFRNSWLFCGVILIATARGEAPTSPFQATAEAPIREIFVPFEDLNVILDNDHRRVFLTREEYEDLVQRARSKPHKPAPHKVALISAHYHGELSEGRALIHGDLIIDVLEDGLFALPLNLAGVGIRSALLDGRPAPLFRSGADLPTLLVQGRGRHQFEIQLTATLQTAAAQQTLQMTLPTQAATRFNLSVPGNVELKGGAAVLQRTYDAATDKTRLELLPHQGSMALAMSLNNRLTQEQRLLVARSVIIDEVTQGYERLHATVSYRVLHGTADQLRLVVPTGFDVVKVESHLLARWQEQQADGRRILEVTLREPVAEQVVLHLTFNRTPAGNTEWLAGLKQWRFPRLEILGAEGQVAVIGLVVEGRLNFENLEAESLIPIDSAALGSAIPASVLKAEPGAPAVRQVASYYAPAGDYSLSAKFVRPPAELKATGNSLIIVADSGLTLQGGLTLQPLAESLFEFSFVLPSGWQITEVTATDGTPLPIERYAQPGSGTRVVVRLPHGISIGQARTVNYRATLTPTNWLAEWTTQTLEIPAAQVVGATKESGAVAVQAVDDLTARPAAIDGLTPLLDAEKSTFGLAGIPTALAYRYETRDFTARFVMERTAPSLAARVVSFFKLQRDNAIAHHEIAYDIREARTREVVFSLPLSAPTELAIRGLDNVLVKQFGSQVQGERRLWTVQLAERQADRVRLAIDLSEEFRAAGEGPAILSLVQAEDVTYQSGVVGIESDDDLDVSIQTTAREVDVGELAGAEYSLGRRVIGSFGYVGSSPKIETRIRQREAFTLPAALIQRAELITQVSASGRAQTVARFDLLSKATLLEIRLPGDSTLWTIYVDDQPTKPQRERDRLLLSLPAQQQVVARKLQLVYESTVGPLETTGVILASAPRLLVRATGSEAEREVPLADLQWQLVLPSGYVLRHSSGTAEPEDLPTPELPASKLLRLLRELGGGVQPWYLSAVHRSVPVPHSYDGAATVWREQQYAATPYPPAASPIAPLIESSRLLMEQKSEESITRSETILGAKAKTLDTAATPVVNKRWALQGIHSLKIEIEPDAAQILTFRSLGEEPQLSVTVVAEERLRAGALGLAGLLFLIGIGLTHRPVRQRVTYVVVLLLVSTVPMLMTGAFDAFGPVFDYGFFAGCALAVYFPLAALVVAVVGCVPVGFTAGFSVPRHSTAVNSMILAAMLALPYSAMAQTSPSADDIRPVAIPTDAIIVPYDPDQTGGPRGAEKIFVPYAKYLELWNRANPGKKIQTTKPPVDFALAGAAYETALTAGDHLSLVGRMEIQVYTDKPVAVPLTLVNGVLEKATVDGQAARLQVVEQQGTPPKQSQAATQTDSDAAHSRLLLLHLAGQGRKTIELHIRLGLTRQGGWRIARGQVPAGPATALTLTVPETGTEIRQQGLLDRATFETTTPGERIASALPENGQILWQWRSKTGQAAVDQALTARSVAAFDVRDDSLRLTWQVRLDFGRAYRDTFSLSAPADFLVESVSGDNVRGWTTKREADQQRIDVTLLKPVQGGETLALRISKRGRVGTGDLAKFAAPVIRVEGAALEQGELAVRTSPRLEVRTLVSNGLTRAEANLDAAAIERLADAADAAVLALRTYQRFSYVRPAYQLTFSASELPQNVTAEVRAALRIADRDTTLDAAIVFQNKGPALYRTRLYLPADLAIERISPANLDWSVTPENGKQLLTVQLVDGRTSAFTLAIFGKLPAVAAPTADLAQSRSMPLPKIEILDVQKQSGEIVVLPDPDTDVRLDDLRNAEAAPITTAPAWMKPEQQRLAKATLRYRAADYAATLRLTTRTPLVSAHSITNIKVTPRSIEETVLFHFRIEQAGIRSVSLLVPNYLANARLKASLLKQKTISRATDAAGQPLAGMTRLTLELQDFVRGDYSVLLEHDRLFIGDRQTVTLCKSETGRTDRRLVALENSGRDELVTDETATAGLDPVHRQQQSWRDLTAVLGDQITQAYAVRETETEPRLTFSALKRQEAEKAGARIGLATTLLVVDASGGYRALVQYRLTNATQQFLQLTLPDGARLWTANVAGEPVKPAEAVPPQAGVVRIPLVKTAEGEGDYLVELKYGGRIAIAPGLGGAEFPLIRQTSVNVELSQLRLLLPESRRWFNFQGTMRQVVDDSELMKGFQSYLNRRIQYACSALSSANDYTKIRAAINLNESRTMLENSLPYRASGSATQPDLHIDGAFAANSSLLSQAEQQAQTEFSSWHSKQSDNRGRLNQHFGQQAVQRAKNVVSQFGSNFDSPQVEVSRADSGESLNDQFFAQNQLMTKGPAAPADSKGAAQPGRPTVAKQAGDVDKPGESRFLRGEASPHLNGQMQARENKSDEFKLPEIAAKKELDELQLRLADEPARKDARRRAGGEQIEQLQKYQDNLQQNLARGQQMLPGQPPQPGIQGPSRRDANGLRDRSGGGWRRGEGGGSELNFGGFGGMPGIGVPGMGMPGMGMPGGGVENAPSGPAGMGMPGGEPALPRSMMPAAGAVAPLAVAGNAAATSNNKGEELAQLTAGLASLDVQLPERGRLYQFTTPRGEIAVSANSIPTNALSRMLRMVTVFAIAALTWALTCETARRTWRRMFASWIFGTAIILFGIVSVVTGVLPIAGLLGVLAGTVMLVRQRNRNSGVVFTYC